MTPEVIFGWLASALCTLILVPQIIKAFKTQHTDDVSMSMLMLSVSGNFFWALHASLSNNVPLLVGASLIATMSVVLIIFKYKFDSKTQ